MLLKTILNHVTDYKSFVFEKAVFSEKGKKYSISIKIRARKNSKPICSICGNQGKQYDRLPQRSFEFIPVWGIFVFFLYCMRRINCLHCGKVLVETVPWSNGKNQVTEEYSFYLSKWCKYLSVKDVCKIFKKPWGTIFKAMKRAVDWGLENINLEAIQSIGVDEVLWHRGHKYLTVVYQIDENAKRLLWIGKDRKEETLESFFKWFGKQRNENLKYICSDMWKPYLKVIKEKASNAIHVLDRYHIMSNMNKAIDKVRAEEVKKLKSENKEPILTNSRWVILKRQENLTDKQDEKLSELLQYNLKTVKSYLLKENFQFLWQYISPYWAGIFLDKWCKKTMLSKIEPMKKMAKSIRKHKELILNWFKAKGSISSGSVEGLNNKLKLTVRKSYGFSTFKMTEVALYHALGNLPEKEFTHKFF